MNERFFCMFKFVLGFVYLCSLFVYHISHTSACTHIHTYTHAHTLIALPLTPLLIKSFSYKLEKKSNNILIHTHSLLDRFRTVTLTHTHTERGGGREEEQKRERKRQTPNTPIIVTGIDAIVCLFIYVIMRGVYKT